MATFYLLNTTRTGTAIHYAGTLFDDANDDVAALRRAGGSLWPSDDPLVASAAARVADLRVRGGDGSETIDRVMAGAAAESSTLRPRSWVANAAALSTLDDSSTIDGRYCWTLDTRFLFTLSRLSTAPVDGVAIVASKSSNGGKLAGRWVSDYFAYDAADLSRSLAEDVPATFATLRTTGARYSLAPTSATAANGTTVINARSSAASFDANRAPVGLGTNPGRWLRVWP